jgi:hypothetical protein
MYEIVDAVGIWEKPKRLKLAEVLLSCEKVLGRPKGQQTRRAAYWNERMLEPFIERLAQKLIRGADFDYGMHIAGIHFDTFRGRAPVDLQNEDERVFAKLLKMQVNLLKIALQTDDPTGFVDLPWDARPKPRRPSSNGYTQEYLRSVSCLVQKDNKGFRSFNACWEAHNIPKSPPKIPTENGKRMTSTRAARLLSNLLTATIPPKNWSEANLKAAQNNAKLATVEFGLDLAMLEKLAAR